MKNFDYVLPTTADQATDALDKVAGARLKAGGTDLLSLMKSRITEPATVVNIAGLEGLTGIRSTAAGQLWIGAATTIADVERSERLAKVAPAVAQAAAKTATPLVRNKATVGGNLCQRPRCWYFRHPDYPCTKKGGEICYAQEGENKYHAIFENVTCNIIHPSNLAPALWVHDAAVLVAAGKEARRIPIAEFWVLPEEDIGTETVLERNEMVTGVTFQPLAAGSGSAYMEIREKQSYDWSLTNASARVDLDGAVVGDVRIVVSAVAPVPLRREEAEAVLRGKPFTEALAWKAGEAAVADATPLRDNKYKVRMLKANVAHALIAAYKRAQEG